MVKVVFLLAIFACFVIGTFAAPVNEEPDEEQLDDGK